MRKRAGMLLAMMTAGMVFAQPLSALAEAETEVVTEAAEETENAAAVQNEEENVSEESDDLSIAQLDEIYPNVEVGEWTSETFSLYFPAGSDEQEQEQEITLHFRDTENGRDIPYLSLREAMDLQVKIEELLQQPERYDIEIMSIDDTSLLVTRGETLVFIYSDEGRITFDNYDSFFIPKDGLLFDMTLDNSQTEEFLTRGENSYIRKGNAVTFDLKKYGIDIYAEGDDIYLPLQTFNDIFLMDYECYLLYNKECVVLAAGDDNSLDEYYYTGKAAQRSDELVVFTYHELCMALDANYGLKEEHNITDFNELFLSTGLVAPLVSSNPIDVVRAINELTLGYMGDLHSGFIAPSYLTGSPTITWNADYVNDVEISQSIWDDKMSAYSAARFSAMGTNVPAYQEVGNTAYVTFDNFLPASKDYYTTSVCEDEHDTIGILIYAHSQIMREDSPIENVVLDLSNNTGGTVYDALYTLSWLMGSCTFNVQDSLTQSQSSLTYMADVNLDHEYDELDTVQSKNVFILMSPSSFSCGNLVPSVCKAAGDGKVTLIGETSGGGACIVQHMCLADGTRIRMSSRKQISYVRNGAFHNVEDGVEPDVRITNPENLYDREALTEYINQIR